MTVWTRQPQRYVASDTSVFRPDFVWLGSAPGSRWARGNGLTDLTSPVGRGLSFVGNTYNAVVAPGASTVVETACTFIAVFTWLSGGANNYPQLVGSTTSNSGYRLGDVGGSGGTLGIIKGGVVALSAISLTSGVAYVCVASHRTDTGEAYIIAKPVGGGALLRATDTNTFAAAYGDGNWAVGISRTDYPGAWNGDIYLAVGGNTFLSEAVGMRLLRNPWQLFRRRADEAFAPPAAAATYVFNPLSGRGGARSQPLAAH